MNLAKNSRRSISNIGVFVMVYNTGYVRSSPDGIIGIFTYGTIGLPMNCTSGITNGIIGRSNRKAMNRNWSNQKANHALKTKTGNK